MVLLGMKLSEYYTFSQTAFNTSCISLHHLQECHPGAADRRTYQCAQKNNQQVHGKKYQWTTFYGGMLFCAVYHIQREIQVFSDGCAQPRAGTGNWEQHILGQILNKKFINMKNNRAGWSGAHTICPLNPPMISIRNT